MNKSFLKLTILIIWLISISAFGQQDLSQQLREIEYQQSRLRQQQSEIQTKSSELELERANRRLEMLLENGRANEKNMRIDYLTMLKAAEQERAAKQVLQAQQSLRMEVEQNEVHKTNNIFLGIVLIFIVSLLTYMVKKTTKGEAMFENQKFGIVVIVISILLMILVFMISVEWVPQYDVLNNLMTTLRVKLIKEEYSSHVYMIDLPTRYVILACLTTAAYGLTTFLGITPVPIKKEKIDSKSSEIKK